MGFNKKLLPSLKELEDYLEKYGVINFEMKWIRRVDSWDGPNESIQFIINYLNDKHNEKVSNNLPK